MQGGDLECREKISTKQYQNARRGGEDKDRITHAMKDRGLHAKGPKGECKRTRAVQEGELDCKGMQ
jgi:hypothetical protein